VPETWTDRNFNQPAHSEHTHIPFAARHLAELAELLKSTKNFDENPATPVDRFNS